MTARSQRTEGRRRAGALARTAVAIAASAALHAAAWQVAGARLADPRVAPADPAVPVIRAQLVASVSPAAGSAVPSDPRVAAAHRSEGPGAAAAGAGGAGGAPSGQRAVPAGARAAPVQPSRSGTAPHAPAITEAPGAAIAPGGAPVELHAAGGLADGARFLEAWEVDREPEYLYPPLGLDQLPARVGRLEARVALWVDALGRLVRIEVDGDDAAGTRALHAALSEAFGPVTFLPARLGEQPVAVRLRYELALDPLAPQARGFTLIH